MSSKNPLTYMNPDEPAQGEILVNCGCGNKVRFRPTPAMINNMPHFSLIIMTHEDVAACARCMQVWTIGFSDNSKLEFMGIPLDAAHLQQQVVLAKGTNTKT